MPAPAPSGTNARPSGAMGPSVARRQEPSGPSLPGGCGCLRRDSRATAIVTAAASTARPMTCPPMSRTSSGRPAERSIVLVEGRWLAAPVPEAAEGDGDTCGKAEPRFPVDWIPAPGWIPEARAVAGGREVGGDRPDRRAVTGVVLG